MVTRLSMPAASLVVAKYGREVVDRVRVDEAKRLEHDKTARKVVKGGRRPLHTSLLEGIDNKIKVIKPMAHGFRDDDYVFLKIRAAFPGIPG